MLNQEKTETTEHQQEELTSEQALDEKHTEAAESSLAEEESAADQQTSETEEADDSAELAELQAKLDAAEKESEELRQRVLRAQADFDNFRRRTREEKEELQKYAAVRVIESLLPVIDNFERALEASKENNDFDSLVKGLNMTYSQLMQVLEQEDLKQIQAVGEPFNPEFHQAVMQVESDEHEEGMIVEELQKGYMLKEKVLRPSMVKVSK